LDGATLSEADPLVSSPSARTALAAVAANLVEIESPHVASNPLGWPGHPDHLAAASSRTGETESVIAAEGSIADRRATLIAFDFRFLGGSMGEAAGARIAHAFARARDRRQPIVSLIASGGARIQEGMRALIQMQSNTAAWIDARKAGIPHVSVARNPTTGGVWVTLGTTADVIIGVRGATLAFAGPRVRGQATDARSKAEAQGSAGLIDVSAPAEDIPGLVADYVRLLGGGDRDPVPCPVPDALGAARRPSSGWEAVSRARSAERPRAEQYLNSYFTERVPISGDRVGGRDDGMLCGFGLHAGQVAAYVAQTGTANTAAGFRTAARLLRLADRLGIPVLTLIDTPGADNSGEGEASGTAAAIGEAFIALTEATVPVTSLLIGEGGSGGGLALAARGRLWVTPDSYFSVIAPESAAAILCRDPSRGPELAELLRLGPSELVELGIAAGLAQSRSSVNVRP
jgi:acetyl-CoA carboxylase carboxyl transferase subunit beta